MTHSLYIIEPAPVGSSNPEEPIWSATLELPCIDGDTADTVGGAAGGAGSKQKEKKRGKGKEKGKGKEGTASKPKDLSKAKLMVKVLEGGVCLGTTDIDVGSLLKPGANTAKSAKSNASNDRALATKWYTLNTRSVDKARPARIQLRIASRFSPHLGSSARRARCMRLVTILWTAWYRCGYVPVPGIAPKIPYDIAGLYKLLKQVRACVAQYNVMFPPLF